MKGVSRSKAVRSPPAQALISFVNSTVWPCSIAPRKKCGIHCSSCEIPALTSVGGTHRLYVQTVLRGVLVAAFDGIRGPICCFDATAHTENLGRPGFGRLGHTDRGARYPS